MSYDQPQHGGAADGYYQGGQQDIGLQQQAYQPSPQQYKQQPEQPQQYPQQPPQYGNQPSYGQGEKQGFNQTFRVDKPKYNDIWAALLFIAVFLGFIAVSGLAIHGYSATKSSQGGGIYGNASAVGLNTNTIVLLYTFLLRRDTRKRLTYIQRLCIIGGVRVVLCLLLGN